MSSPSPSDGPAPPSARRFTRQKRGKLRNGTFILPGTGERVRRQITLRNPASFDGSSRQDGVDPLLPLRRARGYSQAGTFRTAIDNTVDSAKSSWKHLGEYLKTPTAKGIMKCSLALRNLWHMYHSLLYRRTITDSGLLQYLLGSMATFLPPIANFLGHQDGKHMVATVTVYFHPARSAGSMEEAFMLGIIAFCYAVFISVSSMATAFICESQLGLIELGHALILIVFCGGGLGFVGWFKQRFNAPLVSVGCSLTSLAIITVLTKENAVQVGVFSGDKIVQVMKMILLGMFATSVVSLLLWPVSARTALRDTMIRTTDSFGDMLTMITRGFLSGSETDLRSSTFNGTLKRYKSVFTELTKNLKEAKLEHYVLGTEDEYKLEARLVDCLQRLSQSIGGLRSAATTQFALLRETATAGNATRINSDWSIPDFQNGFASSNGRQDRFAVLTAIEEASEEGSGSEDQRSGTARPQFDREVTDVSLDSTNLPSARTPAEIFSRFIMHLGPSMKSLAYTLGQILDELPFGPAPDYSITINEHFMASLTEALQLYSAARAEALKQLYKSKELDKDRPASIEADFEEVAASCGYFSFSLQDFASEMQNYLNILEELKEETEKTKSRSWKWMLWWRKVKKNVASNSANDPEQETLIEQNGANLSTSPLSKSIPEIVMGRRGSVWNAPTEAGYVQQGLYCKMLNVARILERDDVRFAFKVGIGAALYALFAFIPLTRPFYQHWRGEWGLLSYMLVCSMTIGASNTTGSARFIGTFIGAIIAMIVWAACQGNPFALAFCGWLVSIPCFYIIIAKGKGPFGRFIMLTYNLSCLYAYSLSIKEGDDDDDEGGVTPIITEIALHRVVAVLAGVIWGMVITRMIWPISARQKFKDGLALLWLRMGLIWKRDPLSTLTEGESPDAYMNLSEEMALQRYLLRLDSLRGAASSEFELRGPFPSTQYGRILDATNKILDAFHAMNVVIQKNLSATEGEAALLKNTADERNQLCSRISHLFQVMASSMKLEYPLNDALPSTTNARERLLAKIFQYRKIAASEVEEGQEEGEETEGAKPVLVAKDEDYEMLYAYTLVTGQLAEEIKRVEREVEELFGVLDEELLVLR
ncbi:hypothetical protein D0Z07_1078 [Hyphodiscus hymeniophilus]|uniref:Uncharacterized protein n=1 Tax=Hyphodiscus hymeniophilus TaxID=353542 RepID=A0A9P7B0I0_9HELO|nr:hypothetical protein D0Z07_1078 [Hyphodiscus hymeniophilus]